MPPKFQREASALAFTDDDTVTVSTENDAVLLEFDVVEEFEHAPAFSEVDGGVFVSASVSVSEQRAIMSHLMRSGIGRGLARHFVQALGEKRGEWVADILGFTPRNKLGVEIDPSGVDIHFGKLYLPSLDGFTASVAIESNVGARSDLTIKVPGLGAGGAKTFECRITQTKSMANIPVDLVIPAHIKIVEWCNAKGHCFHTLYPVNISRRLVGRMAENPFDSYRGYHDICRMPGRVDHFDTVHLCENEEVTEEINTGTRIRLSLGFTLPSAMTIEVLGAAVVNNRFKVIYSLPVGYLYASFVKHAREFQHLWAVKRD